jgi:hypothetical protein
MCIYLFVQFGNTQFVYYVCLIQTYSAKYMNISERRELATRYLQKGDQVKIAEASGVSEQAVCDYINGRYINSVCAPFVEAMIDLRKSQASEKIDAMAKSIQNTKR